MSIITCIVFNKILHMLCNYGMLSKIYSIVSRVLFPLFITNNSHFVACVSLTEIEFTKSPKASVDPFWIVLSSYLTS